MYKIDIRVLIEREKKDISLILEMISVLLQDISEGKEYQVSVESVEADQ